MTTNTTNSQVPPDWDFEKQGGYLIGYGECLCIMPRYCDGKCSPIYVYRQPQGQADTSGLPG